MNIAVVWMPVVMKSADHAHKANGRPLTTHELYVGFIVFSALILSWVAWCIIKTIFNIK